MDRKFIDTRDLVERKVSSTRNLQHSTVPPKSSTLNFELGASEKAKEVRKQECGQLCAIVEDAKKKTSHVFHRLIIKVADWETATLKHSLIEKVMKAILKFTKLLIDSLLIKPSQSNADLALINHKSRQTSILITEKMILD